MKIVDALCMIYLIFLALTATMMILFDPGGKIPLEPHPITLAMVFSMFWVSIRYAIKE